MDLEYYLICEGKHRNFDQENQSISPRPPRIYESSTQQAAHESHLIQESRKISHKFYIPPPIAKINRSRLLKVIHNCKSYWVRHKGLTQPCFVSSICGVPKLKTPSRYVFAQICARIRVSLIFSY